MKLLVVLVALATAGAAFGETIRCYDSRGRLAMTVQVGANVVISDEDTGASETFSRGAWNRGGYFKVKDGGLNDYEIGLDYDNRGASRISINDCREESSKSLVCR